MAWPSSTRLRRCEIDLHSHRGFEDALTTGQVNTGLGDPATATGRAYLDGFERGTRAVRRLTGKHYPTVGGALGQ